MKSIIQNEKQCYICGTQLNLECHHVFPGTANRKLSEKYGLKVWLCLEHHTGGCGVHYSKLLADRLRRLAQEKAMEYYDWSVADFRRTFGKNYI